MLNELGTKARAKGLWVYGHNHDAEFATKLQYDVNGDGVKETVPAIEVVMLNTDPSLVTFEIDVHWALEGLGYNQDALVAFLRKYSKRISMLHVKGSDPTQNPGTIPSTDFARITDAGGPKDVTDWKRIFDGRGRRRLLPLGVRHVAGRRSPPRRSPSNLLELRHVRQGPRRVAAASAARCRRRSR